MSGVKEARERRADRAARTREAQEFACKACHGYGKRLVPNKRERGIPPQDFGPAFYGDCPDCKGAGRTLSQHNRAGQE